MNKRQGRRWSRFWFAQRVFHTTFALTRRKPNHSGATRRLRQLSASIGDRRLPSNALLGVTQKSDEGTTKSRLVASWHKKRLIPARGNGPVHAGYANSSIALDDRQNGGY
jgi:hypothetical protein